MIYDAVRSGLFIVASIAVTLWVPGEAAAHDQSRQAHQAEEGQVDRTMHAVRTNPRPPVIDGILDEGVWGEAPVATGFRQREPDDGEPATEKTIVKIVYDDDAIYLGIDCLDSEPDRISAPLDRRDSWPSGDRIVIYLDPRHDHKTGFMFAMGPSGWKADGVTYKDGRNDRSWDGIWEGRALIHGKGWSVECRIPYRVLRFSQQEKYTWGIQIQREILRKQETARWVHVPKKASGWNSRFGHLAGVADISPPRSLELSPFTVGKVEFEPPEDDGPAGREFGGTAGVDVRYGLTPGISLNATINPDFGQVEADPAVLNLGVFETFFGERRPFFLEGSTVHKYSGPGIVATEGPARLFHSRRIGAPPHRISEPDDADIVDRPDATTILAAANLSGKTSRGASFSIVDAWTGREYAAVERTQSDPLTGEDLVEQFDHKLEPLTHHLVARGVQDLFEGSHVGAFASTMDGEGILPAYVGSVDGELNIRQRTVKLFTRWTGSATDDADGVRRRGYEGSFLFSKTGGTFGGEVYVDTRSPGFDVNDLGYMDRNDRTQVGAWVNARIRNPYWLGRSSMFNFNVWQHWTHDGVVLRKGWNANMWHDLHNYWGFGLGIGQEFSSFDDLVTRGGPVMLDPPSWDIFLNSWSDNRKPVQVGFGGNWEFDDYGQTTSRGHWGNIRIRPAPRVIAQIISVLKFSAKKRSPKPSWCRSPLNL